MSNEGLATPSDPYIEHLKRARDASSVLKTRLANVRASLSNVAILAFEGDDDKLVYYQWIRRVRPNLQYEAFPCGGKKEVRQLKETLARDLSNLGKGVYFFVDRDFDDLSGFVDSQNVFMTDMYAVENYLVSEEVLEELLKTEFPCQGRPQVRVTIRGAFTAIVIAHV